jgi:hypothetical protein
MPSALVAERLVAAQSEVKRACDLLIAPTPEALNRCQDALQSAVSEITQYRQQEPQHGSASATELALGLRAEIVRASRLLQNLARFYRGWEHLLGSMSGGYLVGGIPAPVTRAGRICCRG